MPLSYTVGPLAPADPREVVLVQGSGVISAQDAFDLYSALALDPRANAGVGMLVDTVGMQGASADGPIRDMMAGVWTLAQQGLGRVAVIMPAGMPLGQLQLAASLALREGVQIRPFADETEARTWLSDGGSKA